MSPIRSDNRRRYPANWGELRFGILRRAGLRCECRGHCGFRHTGNRCGARHLASVWREEAKPERWHCFRIGDDAGFLRYSAYGRHGDPVRVVLTVAHLDHDPGNNAFTNLLAMCQFCHLNYDRADNRRRRASNRRKAKNNTEMPLCATTEPTAS